MFCPSCGAEASAGLSYCKRCGARIGASRDDSRPRVAGLVWAVSTAVVLVTLGGFMVILGFVVEFGKNVSNLLIALLGLLLLVVLAVDYLLARQLSRLIGFHLHGGDAPRGVSAASQPPAQLEAPRPSADGALEQTTRTLGDLEQATRALDPVPREPEDGV